MRDHGLQDGRRLSWMAVTAGAGSYTHSRCSAMLLPRLILRSHATPRRAAHVAVSTSALCLRALHSSPVRRALDMEKVNTTERLAELRRLMKERQIDVYSMKYTPRLSPVAPADTICSGALGRQPSERVHCPV